MSSAVFAKVKEGDRFLYHDRGSPTQRHIGRKGTVIEVRNGTVTARVVFDGDTRSEQVSTANIERIDEAMTVEGAIALLQQHGTVTFVPKFTPVIVKLNSDYNAVIQRGYVEVGCQTFSFGTVLTLAEQVKKVQAAIK